MVVNVLRLTRVLVCTDLQAHNASQVSMVCMQPGNMQPDSPAARKHFYRTFLRMESENKTDKLITLTHVKLMCSIWHGLQYKAI